MFRRVFCFLKKKNLLKNSYKVPPLLLIFEAGKQTPRAAAKSTGEGGGIERKGGENRRGEGGEPDGCAKKPFEITMSFFGWKSLRHFILADTGKTCRRLDDFFRLFQMFKKKIMIQWQTISEH